MSFYRPPTNQGTLETLGTVYRALRAWRFYPKGHPSRRSSLQLAHSALIQLLDGNSLQLACGRTSFSFPDGELLRDSSGLSTALAYELFIRRVQKITFYHDLFEEDLLELLRILCLPPELIQKSGGIDTIMAERGIRSIWVNEFDLTAIRSKRIKVEQSGITPQTADEAEAGGDAVPVGDITPQPDSLPLEQQLHALLGRLASCTDDDTYLILTRQSLVCVESSQVQQAARSIFSLIELFADHAVNSELSIKIKEYAQFAIEQIAAHSHILQLVLEQARLDDEISKNALHTVLNAGGSEAIKSAIELMGSTANLKTRKVLSTVLGGLGELAVPPLLGLIEDSRWFIVRNICAILGMIASSEALAPLTKCLHHPDLRVRKEAIRSLAQIGGHDAETAIISILRGADTALYPQAITSLGGMKSRNSLTELLKFVCSKDMFLKSLPLKVDALAAIALIGDHQVTPTLVTLLEERYLLAAARGRQLKGAIAQCLGRLGDARALPALYKLASDGGDLGLACSEAITMIEKTEGTTHGISR